MIFKSKLTQKSDRKFRNSIFLILADCLINEKLTLQEIAELTNREVYQLKHILLYWPKYAQAIKDEMSKSKPDLNEILQYVSIIENFYVDKDGVKENE